MKSLFYAFFLSLIFNVGFLTFTPSRFYPQAPTFQHKIKLQFQDRVFSKTPSKKREKDSQQSSQINKKRNQKSKKSQELINQSSGGPNSEENVSQMINKIKGNIKGKIKYPYIALVKRMEGSVEYEITLNKKGMVSSYITLSSSGHSILDKAVEDFFLNHKFYEKHGQMKRTLSFSDKVIFEIGESTPL
jgi:TonB family protein